MDRRRDRFESAPSFTRDTDDDEEDGQQFAVMTKRRKLLTGGVVSALLLSLFGLVVFRSRIERKPHPSSLSTAASVVPAAVEDPATLMPFTLTPATPERDEIFGTRMMKFGIAIDRALRDRNAAHRELPPAEAALIGEEMETRLGPKVATSMRDMVRVAKATARAEPFDMDSVAKLDTAIAALDNSLLAEKLPYFVDASVITDPRANHGAARRIIVFYEFSVLESNLYAAPIARKATSSGVTTDDGLVRTVRIRRLDRLNYKHTSLGFVNPHRAQAAVLLDSIDDQLVRHILPALADEAAMPFVALKDGSPTTNPSIFQLAHHAGALAREELASLPGVDRATVRDLGEALRERRELFEKWNGSLQALGVGLRPPTGLSLDLSTFEREGMDLSAEDLDQLKKIQERLTSEATAKTYTALRDAFADSVERHEVQHRLDLKSANLEVPLPVPERLFSIFRGESSVANDLRDAVKNELSGYLAQIARDERMPKTTYSMLLRFLINPRTRTSTEAFVALITTEELLRELKIKSPTTILLPNGQQVDEYQLTRAHHEITSASASDLSSAAQRVWARLYERDFPKLTRRSAT
jgi:hypothetical protein